MAVQEDGKILLAGGGSSHDVVLARLLGGIDAAALLATLLDDVTGVGSGSSLANKVMEIQGYVAADDTTKACENLNAFVNEVNTQTGKKLTPEQAASFTAQANSIKAALGC